MDFNAILEPLQSSFIAWVNQYQFTTIYTSLCELTNCQFFFYMLKRVQKFSWTEPIQWNNFIGMQTGEKIKRIRIVGRSVSMYYKNEFEVSVDNLAFNYLQMCLENGSAEILKLVIAFVGILVHNQQIKAQLDQFLSQLQEQKAGLLHIMIQYAAKIGDKITENVDSSLKRQKNLLSKLESLQEELQFYEDYTLKLENKIELLNGDIIHYKIKNQELKQGRDKLFKKVENLQNLNEEITKQLENKTRQQEILNERLTLNRQSAQEILDRLLAENEKQKNEANYLRKQFADKHAYELQNKKLKMMFNQKQNFIQDMKMKLQKQSQAIDQYQTQIKKLNKSITNFQTENQDLKLKVQLLEKSYPTNKTFYCSPEQNSIVVATNLADSYMQSTPKQWFAVEQNLNESRLNNSTQSLNFSLRSANSNNFPSNKGFISIKQLDNSSNQDKENLDPNIPKTIKLSEVEEQKSMEISQNCLKENSLRSELQLAISTIFQLYSDLQILRKQLRSFQQKQAIRTKRTACFAAKVQKMFA